MWGATEQIAGNLTLLPAVPGFSWRSDAWKDACASWYWGLTYLVCLVMSSVALFQLDCCKYVPQWFSQLQGSLKNCLALAIFLLQLEMLILQTRLKFSAWFFSASSCLFASGHPAKNIFCILASSVCYHRSKRIVPYISISDWLKWVLKLTHQKALTYAICFRVSH